MTVFPLEFEVRQLVLKRADIEFTGVTGSNPLALWVCDADAGIEYARRITKCAFSRPSRAAPHPPTPRPPDLEA